MIHPTAVIGKNVQLEDKVQIGPYCIIGFPPEDKKHEGDDGGLLIKAGTIIHGGATIDAGTTQRTVIGRNCYIMKGVHIGHDCTLEDDITIAPHVCLGGRVYVQKGANFGMNAVVHPRQIIGAYSMIGMSAVISKVHNVKPGETWLGNPAYYFRMNKKGLDQITEKELIQFEREWRELQL